MADGGVRWKHRPAEESPHSGDHGGGWEPAGREPEQRSSNDTVRGYGEGAAPEFPSGHDETAASPGASPKGWNEEGPLTIEEGAESNAA